MGGTKMELIPDGDSAWMVGPAAEPIEIVVEKTEQAEMAKAPKAPATGRPTGSGGAVVTVIPSNQEPQELPFEEVPLPKENPFRKNRNRCRWRRKSLRPNCRI